MARLTGLLSYANTEQGYREAEKFADEWAGDNCGYSVVIEDFENDRLHVMDIADAEGFMAEWDSRVIYRADHREERNGDSMPDFQRLRNPVQTCGWCGHAMDNHILDEGPIAVPCAQCPDNTCDISQADSLTDRYTIATLYGGNDCG